MKRHSWCDATVHTAHEGTRYATPVFDCPNTHTQYAIHFCPTFCPLCGGKLTDGAHERFARQWSVS